MRKKLVRYLQTAKTARVNAKDRTDTLPAILKDPTIPMIWDIIQNGGVKNDG